MMDFLNLLADIELLFGVFATQSGKVHRERLIEAVRERLRGSDEPLSLILEARGLITPNDRNELERLIEARLREHGDDTTRLLSSLGAEELLADLASQANGSSPTIAFLSPECPLGTTVGESLAETADFRASGDQETQSYVSDGEGGAGSNGSTGENHGGRATGSRFRILSFYAKGGIGEVYRARDEELGRIVALKRLQPSFSGNQTYRSRFVIEAEINGNLEHPGIVPVHGFGFDREGRPFYAMRMVRGETLHKVLVDYHRVRPTLDEGERSLRLRELLSRFLVVCEAMAYAHHRGVLHRDLKPSNIMLGRYGETQIIDWGLAKATGQADPTSSDSDDQPEPTVQPASGSGLDPTRAGSVIGTLEYICPEAAAGESESLGVPCDIYGLGATLFVILTGRPPARGKDKDETRRIARENAIPTPRSLVPDLPRPLEAICLKALARNPEDRYASALDLAKDLRRWMADEPILALEDRFTDRLARWERSHRTPVRIGSAASAVIAIISIIALMLISIARNQADEARVQAQQNARAATEARGVAESERLLAEARDEEIRGLVVDFLEPLVDGLYLMPGSAPLRVKIAETLIAYYRQLLIQKPDDPEVRANAALIFRIAANLDRMTGKDEDAGRLYNDSLALADQLDDPMLGAWVLIDRSEWHQMNGRLAAAVEDLDSAEARARNWVPPEQEPAPNQMPRFEGVLALNRSGLHFLMGQFEDAETEARFADEFFSRLIDAKDPRTLTRVLQLFSKVNWLASLREQGRIEEASSRAGDVLTLARNAYNSRSFDSHVATAYSAAVQERVTYPLADSENPGDLLSHLDRAVIARYGLYDVNKDIASFRNGLAGAFNSRAEFRLSIGQSRGAGSDARNCLLVLETTPESMRNSPSRLRELGRAEELLAQVARKDGDPGQERTHLESALAAFEAATKRDPDRYHERRDAERLRLLLADLSDNEPASRPGAQEEVDE